MKHVFEFSRRLNDSDAKFFFLGRRRDCNVAMIMVAVVAGEPTLDELAGEALPHEHEFPRLGDYLRQAPLNIAPPVWMPLPAEQRRPEYYAQEISLPPGAGWPEVFARVDELQSEPFRPERAPWQVALLRGVPGGRSALVFKLHHSASDGMALAILFARVFAREVLAAANASIEAVTEPPPREPRLWIALRDRAAALRRWLASARRGLAELADPDWRRREREAVGRMLRPPRRWPLGSYRHARRLAGFRVPAAAWQAEADSRHGGPNELYLALVARIMRRSFGSLDFDAEPLRVGMPIDMRGGRGVHDGRNDAAVGIVELAGTAADLADLGAVRERATAAKKRAAESEPTLFEETLDLLPGPLRAAIEFRLAASCDVLATNMPIPMEGKLRGLPIEMMLMVAPAIGQAVSFSLTTYGDHMYLAGNADLGIAPDPLDDPIEETLVEVFGDRFEKISGDATRINGRVCNGKFD